MIQLEHPEVKVQVWDMQAKFMSMGAVILWEKAENSNLIHLPWTGRRDVDGKEIYAGDIVQICYDLFPEPTPQDEEEGRTPQPGWAKGYVDWNPHGAGWVVRCKSNQSVRPDGTVMTSFTHGKNGETRKIGDIYRNPELL